MADHIHLAALLFSTFVLFVCDSKPLDGYKFPVYTTEFCPRNQKEWSERSSAINCTESNGYLCLPSEDLNELLEFCYFEYQIPIAKGLCMFLRKRDSYIDGYNCRNFDEGCPNSTYRIYEVYKYLSCVSIGNMCFLAEPTCIRTTATYFLSTIPEMTTSKGETNNTMQDIIQFKERNDWVWILTLLGVGALICVPVIMFCQKMKDIKTTQIKKYCCSDNEEYARRNRNKKENSLHMASHNESNSTLHPNSVDDNLLKENIASPIYLTCQNRNDSDNQLLLKNDTDCNLSSSQGLSPLAIDSDDRHENTVQLLIDNEANVNCFRENRRSPLFMACHSGEVSIAQFLIKNGADINLCSSEGYSPLAIASMNRHENMVKLLIDNEANVNHFQKNGASPLFMASQSGVDSIVKCLIKNGADINLCSSKGYSPLAIASFYGHENMVKLLIENGAKVNHFQKNGASPLFIASESGVDSIVKCLIKNGADINLCSSEGYSPLAVASYSGHENTVQLLTKNGAIIN